MVVAAFAHERANEIAIFEKRIDLVSCLCTLSVNLRLVVPVIT